MSAIATDPGRVRYSHLEYEAVLANAVIGIALTRDRRFYLANPRFEQMFGWAPGELVGQPGTVVYPSEESYRAVGEIAMPILSAGGQLDVEWELRRKDGSTFLGRMIGKAIDAANTQQGTIWIVDDITEARAAREKLERLVREQELILGNATIGIAFVRDRVYRRCNPQLERMFGFRTGEMVGQSTRIAFPGDAAFESIGQRMYAAIGAGETFAEEIELQRKDASRFWCKLVGRALNPKDPGSGSIWIHDDVTAERAGRQALEASRASLAQAVSDRTAELEAANARLQAEIDERRQAEARAQHLADHDALTGLPNRRLLEDRLAQAIVASQRNQRLTAVLFVDLDRFKAINDSLGHAVGDEVLKEVARRLVEQLREGDTTCRMGGDEFVVVLPEIRRTTDAVLVAQKAIENLSLPIRALDHTVHVTPSIGIAIFPDDGRDAEALIRNADAAMYHVKETGRGSFQFFTERMNQSTEHRIAFEGELREALERDQLRLDLQPIYDARTSAVVAHEAFVRWQHPRRGVLLPAEFLPLAEESGLILRIGEWVLRNACGWAARSPGALPVSVNLSGRQFTDPRLIEIIESTLAATGLAPERLELEIGETVAMHQTDASYARLRRLKELGVVIAIDDFGTGACSLAALKEYAIDKLKIDCSIIGAALRDPNRKAVVEGMIVLGHALGMRVIAEGVETAAQRDFLLERGCDYLQGRLLAAPQRIDTERPRAAE